MENRDVLHNSLKTCGKLCGIFRRENLGKRQIDVAEDLGYSVNNIAAFEQGRNDNNIIFMWYVDKGILEKYSIEELMGYEEV